MKGCITNPHLKAYFASATMKQKRGGLNGENRFNRNSGF